MLHGDTMDGMASPLRVRVDRQGRLVLPQHLREGLVDVPGELLVRRTSDGLLLSPLHVQGEVRMDADGLPVLDLGRAVTNSEVLAALAGERQSR